MKISITKNRNLLKRIFKGLLVAAFWIGLWQAAYLVVGQEVLVVSPFAVVKRIVTLGGTFEFWVNTAVSIVRVLAGFGLGTLLGVFLAVFACAFPFIRDFIKPFVAIINSTPVASFILLALVWLKTDTIPMFATFLVVVPIVFSNISEGIFKTDRKLLEMAKVYKFGTLKTVRLIYIPSVLPYFVSAFTASLGMAWKAGVAAEVLSIPKYSIGSRLRDAKIYLETEDLFAWTFVVIILSILLERILSGLIKKVGDKGS